MGLWAINEEEKFVSFKEANTKKMIFSYQTPTYRLLMLMLM